MKCKCGNEAELIQPNIFSVIDSEADATESVDYFCQSCYNALGYDEPKEPEYVDGLFYASQMGGLKG